jgi:cytochrome b subunit of formate dehydrogenase
MDNGKFKPRYRVQRIAPFQSTVFMVKIALMQVHPFKEFVPHKDDIEIIRIHNQVMKSAYYLNTQGLFSITKITPTINTLPQ